jgi:hypothetical protein
VNEREKKLVAWVFDLCMIWGTQLSTAYKVAGHFAEAFERGEISA